MVMSTMSGTKGGGLMHRSCEQFAKLGLFPSTLPPEEWDGCGDDVYKYTWTRDADGLLAALGVSSRDLLKLTRSMGFCPHQRCQLNDVAHSPDSTGQCPQGLCFTKIEQGALSYGACCFTDNKFETSQLLGYYNKTQPVPKPIYKSSRIVLGRPLFAYADKDEVDTSYETFINANRVAERLIAAQCPLDSTVKDAKQLIVEQNVTMWVHLSPFAPSGDHTVPTGRPCDMFPLVFFDPASPRFSPSLAEGVLGMKVTRTAQWTDARYSLTSSPGGDGEHKVTHVWFHGWADFVTPHEEFEGSLSLLVDRAAAAWQQGGTVVVSCWSGRGRSGTFAAMLLGRARRVSSVTELVDLVVDLRRHRDGLVETPRQFFMLATMLGVEKARGGGGFGAELIAAVVVLVLTVAAIMLVRRRATARRRDKAQGRMG